MLSERVRSVKPSPTLTVDTKAKAMKAEGHDVINFGVGEPDFDTPDNIKEAAIKAIRDGMTKYTAAGGIVPLKEAVAEKFRKDNALEYSVDEIVISCGAKHTLYGLAEALFDPGDEIIIPAPYWVSYPAQVQLTGATPVILETSEERSFRLEPDAFRKAVTKKTKALILNSPSNPTGCVYDRATLESIAEIAVKNNIVVISDEVYETLLYDGAEHVSIASFGPEIKALTITVNAVSKSHAMTGWRIGYAGGPAEVIKAVTKIQGQSTSNPCSIAQHAAIEALTGPQDSLGVMLVEFDKRRKRLVEGLNAIEGISCLTPEGAFYAFPNVSGVYGGKVKGSEGLAMYLLEEAKVALVHGAAFGSDRHVRISYATSMEDIENALARIREALAAL
jgi:aspartate aminotransferase